jgi:hypothetical protein
MSNPLTNLSFDEWLVHVFDHEVRQPQWYFAVDAQYWEAPAAATVAYITRLFEDPIPYVCSYSNEQLNQGFWYILSNGASDYMFALLDEQVSLEARRRCIRSFVSVFEKLLAARCSAHLSHLDEPGADTLNLACYMWWDIIPIAPQPSVVAHREIDEECLQVMENILNLDSLACQESALHGLGHWQHHYSQTIEKIIGEFITRQPNLRPELLSYAKSARTGCVL